MKLTKMIGIAAVSSLVLVGCSGEPAEEGPTVVSIWVSSGGQDPVNEEFVKKFNAENTDIQIDYQSIASDQATQNMVLALRTGEGPDLFSGPSAAEVVNPGFALNIRDHLSAEFKDAYEGYLDGGVDFVRGDELYGAPQHFNGTRLLINRDLFLEAGLDPANPPKTFSELRAAAKQIKERTGVAGFSVPLAWGGVFQNHIEPLAMASNPSLTRVGLFDRSTQKFAAENFAPIIEMYRGMIADGSMFPGVGTQARDDIRQFFATGQVAMYVGSSLEVGVLNNQLNSTVDWIPVALPVADGKQYLSSSGTISGGLTVNAKTQNVEATIKVFEAWLGYDRICALAEAGLIYPIMKGTEDCVPEGVRGYAEFFPSEVYKDSPDPIAPGNQLDVDGATYETIFPELVLDTSKDILAGLRDINARYDAAFQRAVQSGEIDINDHKD